MSEALLKGMLKTDFHNITPFDIEEDKYYTFDLSDQNMELKDLDLNDEKVFNDFIFGKLKSENAIFGVGKYNENRRIYQRSEMFNGEENRSLHLGLDIWAEPGTPIFSPANAIVHSFADNNQHGDYGPTIILQHELNGYSFYTLFGHLSRKSLENISVGQKFKGGDQVGTLGTYEENVHWPPHLHLQVITDMKDYEGDFPGVCKPSEKDFWLSLCPNPNLLIGLSI